MKVWRVCMMVMAGAILAGCAGQDRLLPVEAPDSGGIVRVSRVQGQIGGPLGSAFADTCQVIELGDVSGCVEIERDGCSVKVGCGVNQ